MSDPVASEGLNRQDLSFGQVAIREQFVTPDRVLECLEIQRKQQGLDGESKRIGEILIEKGYLTRDQAGRIVDLQSAKKHPPDRPSTRSARKPLVIPGYEILEVVGRGANGTVYRARQISMDRMVAIKVLTRKQGTDKGFVERFIREAQVVAKLNHENIILGIDVGESEGSHYFVMEYVDGEPVSAILRREKRLDEKRSIGIALPILKALSHARENRLVHRDVKPENIMMTRNGVVKLCDLGLAKQTREGGGDLTREGVSVGTPNYISPEQARGESEIDIRSDIYSLGASLYHMVTGGPVFTGLNAMAIMTRHVTDQPDPPVQRFSGVSAGLNAVILKMLQKRREDRYQKPEEVFSDLEAVLAGHVPSVLSGKGKITRRVQRKSDLSPAIRTRRLPAKKSVPPVVPVLVVLGIAVGIVFLVVSSMQGGNEGLPKKPVKAPATAPKKTISSLETGQKKFEEDKRTFEGYWKAKIQRMEPGWIQAIHARGELYLQQHTMKATEQKMEALVRESRAEVNQIILERVWNDLHAKAEEALKRGEIAGAIRLVESIESEYLHFRTEPKRIPTEAGELRGKFLKHVREEVLPGEYLLDRKRIAEAKGIEPYSLLSRMFEKYGDAKRPELLQLRKMRLDLDMRAFRSDPLSKKKLEDASAHLASLGKKWPGDPGFQADLRREEEAMKKAEKDWIVLSETLAADLYQKTFLVPFEAALSRRDMVAARALLHEVYFGKAYAAAAPSILVGQVDRTLLGAALNPARVAAIDYSSSVKAVEKAAREALGNGKPAAVDYYVSLRSYLLLEDLVEDALRGVVLQANDSRRFSKYSAAMKKTQKASIFQRKAGSSWKIKVTQSAGGGTLEKNLFLAPKSKPSLPEGDVILLAKRANLRNWKSDPYFALQAGLLHLYAGESTEAATWLGGVTGVDARFEIDRFLERLKNASAGNAEASARTKFKQASKLIARQSKRALALCRELRDQFGKTEWMTTRVGEKKKSRLEVVLSWIQILEKKPGKSPDGEQGLFRGDVQFKGSEMVAFYDFSNEGLDADFSPFGWRGEELEAKQERNGLRLSGRGYWYWKAPLEGDVTIEIDIVANADQAIGFIVHGESSQRGYVAIADQEGGDPWGWAEGQAFLYRNPVSAVDWREKLIDGGKKPVSFRRGKSYQIKMVRKGNNLAMYVDNKPVLGGKNDVYHDGKVGIHLSRSDILLKRLRVTGRIDENWLREEEERLEREKEERLEREKEERLEREKEK